MFLGWFSLLRQDSRPRTWTGHIFFPGSQCKEEGFLTPHAGRVQALELICIQGSAQGPSVRMSTWENFHLRLQSASPPLCMLEESVSLFLFFLFPPAAMATKEHP